MLGFVPQTVDFGGGKVVFQQPSWAADRERADFISKHREEDSDALIYDLMLLELYACYAGSLDVVVQAPERDAAGDLVWTDGEVKLVQIKLPTGRPSRDEFYKLMNSLQYQVVEALYGELVTSGVALPWFRRFFAEEAAGAD